MKATLLLLPLAALLAACTPVSSPSASTTGGAGAQTGDKLQIVYIAKSTGNPYFSDVDKGFEKAAKELDFEFTSQAPATADATSQLSIIKDQIQRGVDVIAITPNSPNALNEALDEAKAKGITVICVDADLTDNESHRDAAVLPVDFATVGPSQIELLGELMGYEGEFAILSATTDAPNQNAWIAGMKETLKDPKYSKMKLVATVYGDDESQKSSTETEALLAKFPNLKGILSPTSVGLAAAAQVIENAGVYPGGAKAKNGGLHLTGLSTPNQLKNALSTGAVAKFQLWSPADMGYLAAQLGVKASKDKVKIESGTDVEIPGRDAVKVGDKGVVFTGPLVTFSKENIADYDF